MLKQVIPGEFDGKVEGETLLWCAKFLGEKTNKSLER
jgi:hypothetical protein